jgi:mono/diheme cytochrome c family protein
MKTTLLSAIFCGFFLLATATAATAATGEKLVKGECAACHAIGDEARSPESKAPRFADVAAMPSTTELSLKVFLRSSHKNMPNIMLEPDEIDAAANYILGLKKKN